MPLVLCINNRLAWLLRENTSYCTNEATQSLPDISMDFRYFRLTSSNDLSCSSDSAWLAGTGTSLNQQSQHGFLKGFENSQRSTHSWSLSMEKNHMLEMPLSASLHTAGCVSASSVPPTNCPNAVAFRNFPVSHLPNTRLEMTYS